MSLLVAAAAARAQPGVVDGGRAEALDESFQQAVELVVGCGHLGEADPARARGDGAAQLPRAASTHEPAQGLSRRRTGVKNHGAAPHLVVHHPLGACLEHTSPLWRGGSRVSDRMPSAEMHAGSITNTVGVTANNRGCYSPARLIPWP